MISSILVNKVAEGSPSAQIIMPFRLILPKLIRLVSLEIPIVGVIGGSSLKSIHCLYYLTKMLIKFNSTQSNFIVLKEVIKMRQLQQRFICGQVLPFCGQDCTSDGSQIHGTCILDPYSKNIIYELDIKPLDSAKGCSFPPLSSDHIRMLIFPFPLCFILCSCAHILPYSMSSGSLDESKNGSDQPVKSSHIKSARHNSIYCPSTVCTLHHNSKTIKLCWDHRL